MRKFLTIVVASLVPIGMWTAGCRQDIRQAAFPKSSEMKGLAKAGDKQSGNRPPRIDPAPIDRDIMNMPESPAMARANAVKDRSDQMAKPRPSDDLFSLHDNSGSGAMASAANYDPRPADIGPTPAGKEFWSRPMNNPMPRSSGSVPADVSAMAPAASDSSFAGPPVQFLPPPASTQPKAKAKGSASFAPIEDVPGIYMDGYPMSMRRNGSPPASRHSLNSAVPGGDALGAPPSLSKQDFMKDLKPTATATRQGPIRLDLSGLVASKSPGPDPIIAPTPAKRPIASSASVASTAFFPVDVVNPSITVRSIPGNFEPLPEPIPIETFMAMHPGNPTMHAKPVYGAAPASSAILDFIPPPKDRTRPVVPKPPTAVKADDMRKALAPLPDITTSPTESKGTPLKLKMPPTEAKEPAKEEFMADFWEKAMPNLEAMLDLELPEPRKKPAEKKGAIVSLPPDLLKKQAEPDGGKAGEKKMPLVEPLPIFRDKTLGKIDDALGAPPAPPIKE